jgi:hypothetical protein
MASCCRGTRMCQLRSDVDAALASRRHGTLSVQRVWPVLQDERTEQASHQAKAAAGECLTTWFTLLLFLCEFHLIYSWCFEDKKLFDGYSFLNLHESHCQLEFCMRYRKNHESHCQLEFCMRYRKNHESHCQLHFCMRHRNRFLALFPIFVLEKKLFLYNR